MESHRPGRGAAGARSPAVALRPVTLANRGDLDDIDPGDPMRTWVHANWYWHGYALLYEDRYPFAGGPGYYAMYCEDPDRIKVEVVAPHAE